MNCTPKVGHKNPTERGAFFMTKFKIEERMAAAQAVQAGGSIASVARQFGMSEQTVGFWYRFLEEHGKSGVKRRTYNWTAEQKYQVLKYMRENNLTCQDVSIQLGISGSSTVWQWEQRYLEKGKEGLENKKKGRKPRISKPKPPKTREEELLDRIQYLEAENAYLKKLNALVAERENRERGNG